MDERIEELFPFYAMGAITDEERAEVEAYIQANPAARTRLEAAMSAVDDLAFLSEPLQPSAPVRENVLAYARRRPHLTTAPAAPDTVVPPTSTWWQRWQQNLTVPLFAGFATITAILLFVWVLSQRSLIGTLESRIAALQPLETTVAELESEIAALRPLETTVTELENQVEVLQRQLDQQNEVLAALLQGQGLAVAGTEVQPQAAGELLVEADGQTAVFIATDLAPLPADQTYQLWLIGNEGPVSEGIFAPNENGVGVLEVVSETAVFNYAAIGVSIEPGGGSPQPTGDIVMLGEISPPDTDS